MGTLSVEPYTIQVIYKYFLQTCREKEPKWCATVEPPEQCCLMPGRERLVHQRLSIYHGVSTYEQHAITSVMTLHEHFEHAAPNRTCIFFHNVAPRHSHTTQPAHRGTGTTDHAHPGMRPTGVPRIGQGVGTRHSLSNFERPRENQFAWNTYPCSPTVSARPRVTERRACPWFVVPF